MELPRKATDKCDNPTSSSSTPVRAGTLTGIVQIATASRMAYARDDQGQLWAWGLNDVGQLGDGTTTDHGDPRVVSGLSDGTTNSSTTTYAAVLLTCP